MSPNIKYFTKICRFCGIDCFHHTKCPQCGCSDFTEGYLHVNSFDEIPKRPGIKTLIDQELIFPDLPGDNAGFTKDGPKHSKNPDFINPLLKNSKRK